MWTQTEAAAILKEIREKEYHPPVECLRTGERDYDEDISAWYCDWCNARLGSWDWGNPDLHKDICPWARILQLLEKLSAEAGE